MSDDEVTAELERLRAENAQLKRTAHRGVSLKVSEKGGLSVYGLGRFPVTLYKEQWIKLLDMADDIRAFIRPNEANLKLTYLSTAPLSEPTRVRFCTDRGRSTPVRMHPVTREGMRHLGACSVRVAPQELASG